MWCRVSYGGPMITGRYESRDGKSQIYWTTRPPAGVLCFYAVIALVIIFKEGTKAIVEGIEIVIFMVFFIMLLNWFQRSGVRKMVGILNECARTKV